MLGAMISISLYCQMIPQEPVLVRYSERVMARPAYERAGAPNWPPELFGLEEHLNTAANVRALRPQLARDDR